MAEDTSDRDKWWADDRRADAFLTLLEGRRVALEQAMWQAPTLTIAAQAFLLAVLTDSQVADTARLWILVAGIAACVAAALALVRLRVREVTYSEAVGFVCEKRCLPDPRPFGLDRKEADHKPALFDRGLRWVGGRRRFPTVYIFWIVALALFVVADVVAYCSTK